MSKKILIYLYEKELAPKGGPVGYNYNLKCQLDKMGVEDIFFIKTSKGDVHELTNNINKIKPLWLKNVIQTIKRIVNYYILLHGSKGKAVVDLNKFDIVHFHSVVSMYRCRGSLDNFTGKVVLTSHVPTKATNEIKSRLNSFEKICFYWLYKKLDDIDNYAFNRADYIIFPCEGAEEPYLHDWDYYREFKDKNQDKYRYLLTGISPCTAKVSRGDVRKKYNIPADAFVICFVGRHNQIKGYDQLKIISAELLTHQNVYVLIAGEEGPLYHLEHERWIEVGWTNDPHSIIAASDVFVLPNKETYFDLIMLEVLSLGKIVVASNTGGNKYFSVFKHGGILIYNSQREAVRLLKKVMALSFEEREYLGGENKKIFFKYFTSEIFANNYIKLINSL